MNVRIIILTIACLALAAGMVFANLNTLITGQTYTFKDPKGTTTTLTFTPSTNVTVGVNSVAQSYAANSKHLNGDRIFGAASDSTAIFYKTVNKSTQLTQPSATGASEFASGWYTL